MVDGVGEGRRGKGWRKVPMVFDQAFKLMMKHPLVKILFIDLWLFYKLGLNY